MDPHIRSIRIFFPCAIFIVLCFAFLFKGCGGGGGGGGGTTEESFPTETTATAEEGGTIQSSDGVLTVVVPAGAVDADTVISVSEVSADELPSGVSSLTFSDDINALGTVYKLEPAGITFNEDITLTMKPDFQEYIDGVTEDVFPIVTVFSTSGDGEFEELLLTKSEVTVTDGSTGTIELQATTNHFSMITSTIQGTSLGYEFGSGIPEVVIGESFNASVIISNSDRYIANLPEVAKGTYRIRNTEPDSDFTGNLQGAFDSGSQQNTIGPEGLFTDIFTYFCQEAGSGFLGFKGSLEPVDSSGVATGNVITFSNKVEGFTCTAKKFSVLILDEAGGEFNAGDKIDVDCISGGSVTTGGDECSRCTQHQHGSIFVSSKGTLSESDDQAGGCGLGCIEDVEFDTLDAASEGLAKDCS